MKIASSTVIGRSAYESIKHKTLEETLEKYENGAVVSSVSRTERQTQTIRKGEMFLNSQGGGQGEGVSGLGVEGMRMLTPKSVREVVSEMEEFKLKTLKSIFEFLMNRGRNSRLGFRNVFEEKNGALSAIPARGVVYNQQKVSYESERMEFEMKGKAVTEDGRSIEFDISLSLSRELYEYSGISLSAGTTTLTDPLMIQLSGSPSLSQTKISFDLDMDGAPDQISFAGSGAGFLALDKNGDGVINDGSELFGPSSGSGFKELAMHDGDRNGWIDENDPVFDKLRVWCKDENGNDRLFALGELGIGAIYLGSADTQYTFKDGANNVQGVMRASGAFLYENGAVGSVHHIDLAM